MMARRRSQPEKSIQARRERDRVRKMEARRIAVHARHTESLNSMIASIPSASVVTLTFKGDVPPVTAWRTMFTRWSEAMRYHDLITWSVGVPHSATKVRGDIHVVCDLAQRPVQLLASMTSNSERSLLHNRASRILTPKGRSLRSVATTAGFGPVVHWRLANLPSEGACGTAAYVLGPNWVHGRIWKSGEDANVGNTVTGSSTRTAPLRHSCPPDTDTPS